MRRWLATCAVLLTTGIAGGHARAEPDAFFALTEDVPVAVRLERGEPAWTRGFTVPEGATRLHVLASSRQDVDLYLRRGSPLGNDPTERADARSEGPTGEERISVAAVPGSWYVTASHPGSDRGGARLTVVVLLEGGGRPPLVIDRTERDLEVKADGLSFRTWFPPEADSLHVQTSAEVVLSGPGGFKAKRESGGGPFVLRAKDGAPPGLFIARVTPAPNDPLLEMDGWVGVSVSVVRPGPPPDGVVAVIPGVEEEFTIGGESPSERSFRVEMPTGVTGFFASIVSEPDSDLDLYVRRGSPMRMNDEEADYLAVSSGREERLSVGGDSRIEPGTYYVDVTTVDVERQARGTLLIGFDSAQRAPTWGPREPAPLAPSAWKVGAIRSTASAFMWYAVDVPPSVRRLFAQVVDATSPVDLVLARRDTGAIVRRSLSERVDESLDVALGDDVRAPGRYLLGVVNRTVGEDEVGFRVAIGFDRPPPLPVDLRAPPFHDASKLNPTERVAAAVAEVMVRGTGGGSATCVTPGGLLLSCRHVFQLGDEREPLQREGILVALPDEFPRPPKQFFLAKMVDADEPMDLALLEITGDVYGRPLPAGLRLPHLPLGDSAGLSLGEHVTAFGYPEAGSEHCRTGIIVSRGIVAGLEADRNGPVWIKTDAWIANGHSGGALVDADNRLVGVPTATLGDRRTLGLVRPVSRIPERWKAMIRKGLEPVSK